MKIKYLAIILAGTLIFTGCTSNKGENKEEGINTNITNENIDKNEKINFLYSNLKDKQSIDYLKKLLLENDIKEEYVNSFFEKVDFYNKTMDGMKGIVDTKTKTNSYDIEFDDIFADETWKSLGNSYNDFNCRLTAFDIFRDNITVDNKFEGDDLNLMVDVDTIKNNPLSKFNEKEINNFKSLYSYVTTKPKSTTEEFIKDIKDEMARRKVKINTSKNISLINGYLYDYEFNESFIGHSGILIKDREKYIFLEKYSFLTPYILLEFNSKKDVYNYLMNRLDIDTTGNGLPPVIFENNDIMSY